MNWKDMLKKNICKMKETEQEGRETLHWALETGNFDMVKRKRRKDIPAYMKQEKLEYPSDEILNLRRRENRNDRLQLSILVSIVLICTTGMAFGFDYISPDTHPSAAAEKEQVIAEHLNTDVEHILVEDEQLFPFTDFNGGTNVTYDGTDYYVELQEQGNNWSISKFVQLDDS